MKTRRPSVFVSAALSGLLGLSLVLTSPPASADNHEYELGCYPPRSLACIVKGKVSTKAIPVKTTPSPQPSPSTPANETALKNLVADIKTNSTPIQVSDEVKIGGLQNTVAQSAILNLKNRKPTIAVTPDSPVSVLATGFLARKANGGYVQVFVSVSGRLGNINLGQFTPDSKGGVATPPLTLAKGARATFIFREIVPFSVYGPRTTPGASVFVYAQRSFEFGNYAAKYGDDILMLRNTVVVTA